LYRTILIGGGVVVGGDGKTFPPLATQDIKKISMRTGAIHPANPKNSADFAFIEVLTTKTF
jgi:hypothetical protein